MIGRLLLNYPDAARRIGMCLALAAFAAGLYGLGIKADWIGKLV
ncbi:MAG: amino acid ABC transporter permease, partial [Mesorhizobium sp.]